MENNKDLPKGWIRRRIPEDVEYTDKQLNSDMRAIFVNQYNLFSASPKQSGSLKNWQILFYHAWGVGKKASNGIMNTYYRRCFHP